MKIGYARVSTREQAASLATQHEALMAAGCERVFSDTISGARSTRPGLDAARSHLREGDSLVVTRLDRLGRSMRDTVTTAAELTDHGVRLVLLDMGLDTSTSEGRLMVGILSALAQQELETIQERTRVGLEHARAQGRVGGRPAEVDPRPARGRAGRAAWRTVRVRGRHPARGEPLDHHTAARCNFPGGMTPAPRPRSG